MPKVPKLCIGKGLLLLRTNVGHATCIRCLMNLDLVPNALCLPLAHVSPFHMFAWGRELKHSNTKLEVKTLSLAVRQLKATQLAMSV